MHSSIGRDDIRRMQRVINPHVRETPTLTLDPAVFGVAAEKVALKLEFLQHAGSFKARGAFANLLTRPVGEAGVAAASGGNHGAAVAYAAQALGVMAQIFVPSVAPQAKLDRIRTLGAQLVIAGDRYDDALQACRRHVDATGALDVHAFDQPETIMGQGSIGAELEEQMPDIDTLLVAVGGGGLIAGIAAWCRNGRRVIGVEPARSPTLTMALAAGRPVDAPADGIAADSLAPKRVGELVFPVVRAYVDRVVLVADSDILDAQRALWQHARIVAEPGGATATAALLSGAYTPEPGEAVGIVVSGANTDAVAFGAGSSRAGPAE